MEPVLESRRQERDALLSQLRAALEADARVQSVRVHGSIGRGDADAWSDLDLWVLVHDADYSHAIRHDFAEGALFIEEAPQNGPEGGTYLMTAHDAPTGAHLVDWYFQPLGRAASPPPGIVLFARDATATPASTPRDGEAWTPDAEADARNKAALFWAMLLVQAKYVARTPVEPGMGFEGFILSLLRDAAAFGDERVEEVERPGLRAAPEKLARLRELARRMADVVPEWSRPQASVERFLRTVERATPGGTDA